MKWKTVKTWMVDIKLVGGTLLFLVISIAAAADFRYVQLADAKTHVTQDAMIKMEIRQVRRQLKQLEADRGHARTARQKQLLDSKIAILKLEIKDLKGE